MSRKRVGFSPRDDIDDEAPLDAAAAKSRRFEDGTGRSRERQTCTGADDAGPAAPRPHVEAFGALSKKRQVGARTADKAQFDARVVTIRTFLCGAVAAQKARGSRGPIEADSNPLGQTLAAPLFQRRYCWGRTHWQVLMQDAVRSSLVVATGAADGEDEVLCGEAAHSMGKVLLHPGEHRRPTTGATHALCVDGQQRITTIMVLLASIRDVAFEILRGGLAAADRVGGSAARLSASQAGPLQAVCDEIEAALFADDEASSGRESMPVDDEADFKAEEAKAASPRGRGGATAATPRGGAGTDEAPCAAARWTPTYLDRAAFAHAIGDRDGSREKTGADAPASLISDAKAFFTAAVRSHAFARGLAAAAAGDERSPEAPSKGDPEAGLASDDVAVHATVALARLECLVRAVLDAFAFVVLELRATGIDAQVAFDSFARKAELGRLFFKLPVARHGRHVASSDLVRNLVMSLWADTEEQERVYSAKWLPLESAVCALAADTAAAAEAKAAERDDTGASSHDGGSGEEEDAPLPDYLAEPPPESTALNDFFTAFLMRRWGVTDLKAAAGARLIVKGMDVAYPSFAEEFGRRLAAWSARASDGGEADAAASAASATADAAPAASDAERASFGEHLLAQLWAFAEASEWAEECRLRRGLAPPAAEGEGEGTVFGSCVLL